MFCKFCGKGDIDDNAKSCPHCQKVFDNAPIVASAQSAPAPKAESVAPQKAAFKNTKPQVEPKDSINMGIASWMLSLYNIIAISSLLIGLLGVVTSPAESFFVTNSLSLIMASKFMLGAFSIDNLPVWVTSLIPMMITILTLTFALLQFFRNKKRTFSKVTLIIMSCIFVITMFLSFGGFGLIVGNLV